MNRMQFARELKSYLEDYGLYTITRSQDSGLVLEVSMDSELIFKVKIEKIGKDE